MTDEERQKKLCADLRQIYRYIANDEINNVIWRAADEIERLAASLAQSDDVRSRIIRILEDRNKEIRTYVRAADPNRSRK